MHANRFYSVMAAVVSMAGCGDSASDAGGGGGSTNQAGGGGGSDNPKQPDEATSAGECFFDGAGGDDQRFCDVFTAILSEPVSAGGLTATVTTSLGVVSSEDPSEGPSVTFISDPVERVTIEATSPEQGSSDHYAPEWVELELRRDGTVIGSGKFERLGYSCRAESRDDWCWEAAPVTLTLTL